MVIQPRRTAYQPPIRPDRARPLRVVRADAGAAERDRQHNFFLIHLRAATTRYGRPYKENAIATHDDALISLDKWLTSIGFAGDYRDVDTPTLNAYLRAYHASHSQGGANTKQRKLSLFFKWLSEEYDVANPFHGKVARYAPTRAEDHVAVLDDELVTALLKVTGGRDLASVRDHAIIRLFASTGMRRGQMAFLRVEDLDLRERTVVVIGQKGAADGHVMAFGHKAAQALARWLRMRPTSKAVNDPGFGWLWVGTRQRAGRFGDDGILKMLKRRAVEAGYIETDIHAHMFRHTYANSHLESGGAEGDLMRHLDWHDRAMVDVYAASQAKQRALADAHRRAIGDRY